MYKCDKCSQEFKYNSHYMRHINKKFACNSGNFFDKKLNDINNELSELDKNIIKIDQDIINIDNNIKIKTYKSLENENKCLFCNNTFKTKGNTSRHIEYSCIIKKNILLKKTNLIDEKKQIDNKKKELNEQKNNIINEKHKLDKDKERDNEIKQLRKDIAKLLKKQAPIINQTINNTQNNLVVINPFGKEDLSHITIQDYKNYLNGFFPGFIKYVEKVHFDENAPQNHNIYVSNLNSKYLSVHNGDRWETKVKTDVIDNLLIKKHNQLADKCEHLEETKQIEQNIIDNFEEFCGSFKDKEAQKTVKTDIMTMLYDNNNKINMIVKN